MSNLLSHPNYPNMTRITRSPLFLAALLALALIIRFYQIGSLSNNFHSVRQYATAQRVRPSFLLTQPDTPAWRLENARLNQEPMLEPPIIQMAALVLYQIAGGENLALPRALSAVFWVIGGYFIYLIGKKLFTPEIALIAMVYFLFAPFGILASRSFQSNPAMVALSVISLYSILLYFENPSPRRMLWLILSAAAAIIVLIYAVFIIFPVYYAFAIDKRGWRRATFSRETILFGFLSLLPSILYYAYGLFGAGFLRSQTGQLIMPALWAMPLYWGNWSARIITVAGLIPLILIINALFMTRRSPAAVLLRSLCIGYIALGLIFNYAIISHSYYSLPLVIITTMAVACTAYQIYIRLPAARRLSISPTLAAVASVFIIVTGLAQYLPTTVVTEDERRTVEVAQEIGDKLEHTSKAIFLTADWGMSLEYYGEMAGTLWPDAGTAIIYDDLAGRPALTISERLQQLIDKGHYQYFIISSMVQYELQPDLVHYLDSHYPLLIKTDDYVIYTLDNNIDAASAVKTG